MVQKLKHLHTIMVDGGEIITRLQFSLTTTTISIGNVHRCRKTYRVESTEKRKAYRKAKKEKISEQSKTYREVNRDKRLGYQREYNRVNKNKRAAYYMTNVSPDVSRRYTEEHRIKISCARRGIAVEEFVEFFNKSSYCHKFNAACRERNRDKYGRLCFLCGKDEINNGRKLSVHHVDMNKDQGCDDHEWSLVPLCAACHGKAHNPVWQARIEYLITETFK